MLHRITLHEKDIILYSKLKKPFIIFSEFNKSDGLLLAM